jgi:hypothetical protein
MSRTAFQRQILTCAIAAFVLSQRATVARADADVRLSVRHDVWKSSTGRCTSDIGYPSVSGVPSNVKARVDGVLSQQLAYLSLFPNRSVRTREAACVKERQARIRFFKEDAFHGFERAEWTVGLARGRWLSVRLHYEEYSGAGQAHPLDYYRATTFDLQHDGYPVPTSGYYLKAQRALLDRAVGDADIAARHVPSIWNDSVRKSVVAAGIDDRNVLVTPEGIEINGLGGDEAERTIIVSVPFSKLAGVGTPGGPLDPATR